MEAAAAPVDEAQLQRVSELDLVEELTGGVTITSAVVDALIASHKDATQPSGTAPSSSRLLRPRVYFGDREAIAEPEMGLVLTTGDGEEMGAEIRDGSETHTR
eukprot:COSAG06_NODE_39024_length_417_cov_0.858491_1_plen_102_part_01